MSTPTFLSQPTPLYILAGITAAIAGGLINKPMLPVVDELSTKIASIAAGLLAAGVLTERVVEVLVGVPRSSEAEAKKTEVAKNESAAKHETASGRLEIAASKDQLAKEAEASLVAYKEQTKTQAVSLAFTIGAVLSLFGIRSLQQIWEFPQPSNGWLTGLDIFFTASLISAGGQGIHQLFTTLSKLMSSIKTSN